MNFHDPERDYTPEREPDEDAIAPAPCATEGCNNSAHASSENGLCAPCEALGWRDELKQRWMENPPNPADTAEAEMQVRIWEAA